MTRLRRGLAALAVAIVLPVAGGCAVVTSGSVEGPVVVGTAPPDAAHTAPDGIPADAQRVRVRWVSDGDTVTVRAVRRGPLPRGVDTVVRLLEIDTPESKHPDRPVECFAQRASRATERLLPEGSVAWVQRDEELHDRYGRSLGYVWNADGAFVNEVLVRRGLARVVHFRPNDRHLDRLRAVESGARDAGRGLWSRC